MFGGKVIFMILKKGLTFLLTLSIFCTSVVSFVAAAEEYDSVIPANTATVLTEGVEWAPSDLAESGESYRLTTNDPAEFLFSGISAAGFKLRVAQLDGLGDGFLSFEISYDSVNFEPVTMTENKTGNHENATVGPVRSVEYISPDFDKPVKAIKVKKGECFHPEQGTYRFAAIDLQYKSAAVSYNSSKAANEGELPEGMEWLTGEWYRGEDCYAINNSENVTMTYRGLNASRFDYRSAEHNGLNPPLLSFEVSYDGNSFTAIDMTVAKTGSYTNGHGWPIDEMLYTSPDFDKPVKAVRVTKKPSADIWYFNAVGLRYEEVAKEYSDTIAANQGSLVEGASAWTESDAYTGEVGFALNEAVATVIDYPVSHSAYFMFRAAMPEGSTHLTFEASYDGTSFEPVAVNPKKVNSYENGENQTINQYEYISGNLRELAAVIRVKVPAGAAYTMVDLKYMSANADKTALKELLDAAKEIENKGYADASWDALQTAIADAEALYNGIASQAAVDAALVKLNACINDLYISKYNVLDGYSMTQQGDKVYYLYTNDYKTFSEMQHPGVETSPGVAWWSYTPGVQWGSMALTSANQDGISMFRDGTAVAPAVAVKMEKAGSYQVLCDNELLDVYVGALNQNKLTEAKGVFTCNAGDYVIFTLKKNVFGPNHYTFAQMEIVEIASVAVEDILLSTDNIRLELNETANIDYRFAPIHANEYTNVIWASENEDVAIVSEDGTIAAVGGGETYITATAGDITVKCKVFVNSPLLSITMKASTVLPLGETEQLTVTYNPANTTDPKDVAWSSSDTGIVSVEDGVIKANAVGTATITATVGDKTAECVVTVVIPIMNIELNQSDLELKIGEKFTFELKKYPENTTVTDPVVWQSTNEAVAAVDQNGVVTAVAGGECTIVATVGGKSDVCTVTVQDGVEKVELDKTKIFLVKGHSDQLSYTYYPLSATNTDEVIWTTSDASIVSVENGKITALTRGAATITVTVGGKSAQCTVVVVEEEDDVIDIEDGKDDENDNQGNIYPPATDVEELASGSKILLGCLILLSLLLMIATVAVHKLIPEKTERKQ